ncbi:MAG: hypothetical protein IKX31_06520 [Muribaculaceae bacterium]|nr:hypothetical protein [Muribaculaceae bacterium]
MNKKLLLLIALIIPFLVNAQQAKYVELDKSATIYKSANLKGLKINADIESTFIAFFVNGQVFYPFAQQVVSEKGTWVQLPVGWVQKKNTKPVSTQPITDNMYRTHYVGTLMNPELKQVKSHRGLANDYDLYFTKVDENSNDVIIRIGLFSEARIFCTGKVVDNVIQCDKFLMVKPEECEGDLADLYFSIDVEKNGIKRYILHYGNHLSTEFSYTIGPDEYTTTGFDMEKMESHDLRVMFNNINKIGTQTKLCISNNTIENLKVADY